MSQDQALQEFVFGLLLVVISSYMFFLSLSEAGLRKLTTFTRRYDRKFKGSPSVNWIVCFSFAIVGVILVLRGIFDRQALVYLLPGVFFLLMGIYGIRNYKRMAESGAKSSDELSDLAERHPWLMRIGITVALFASIFMVIDGLLKMLRRGE